KSGGLGDRNSFPADNVDRYGLLASNAGERLSNRREVLPMIENVDEQDPRCRALFATGSHFDRRSRCVRNADNESRVVSIEPVHQSEVIPRTFADAADALGALEIQLVSSVMRASEGINVEKGVQPQD